MTPIRGIIIAGFFIIIMTGSVFGGSPPDDKQREYMSITPSAPPDRYKKQPVVNPETGAIEMTPVISETARAQKGDFKSKDKDELKREKEERIK